MTENQWTVRKKVMYQNTNAVLNPLAKKNTNKNEIVFTKQHLIVK